MTTPEKRNAAYTKYKQSELAKTMDEWIKWKSNVTDAQKNTIRNVPTSKRVQAG